jgi:hypothetical protein
MLCPPIFHNATSALAHPQLIAKVALYKWWVHDWGEHDDHDNFMQLVLPSFPHMQLIKSQGPAFRVPRA